MKPTRFEDLSLAEHLSHIRNDPKTGHAIVDVERGVWLDVNDAFCRIVGRSREELAVRPWWEVTASPDREYDRKMVDLVIRGELPHYQMPKHYVGAFGEQRPAVIFVSRLVDDEDELVNFYVRAWESDEANAGVMAALIEKIDVLIHAMKGNPLVDKEAEEALKIGRWVRNNAKTVGWFLVVFAAAIATITGLLHEK